MVSPVVALIALGAGVIALTRVGSLTEAFGLRGSDLVGGNQQAQSGEVTTDSLQFNPSIPIPQGSQTTVEVIQSQEIFRTDIRAKQKFDQTASKPQIKTTFFNPKEGGSEPQAGVLLTANSSLKNTVLGLNVTQTRELRAQPFTKQELADITALTTRFNRKSSASQKVSDSPTEIIFKKREQEALARQTLGGSNFVTSVGGVTRGGNIIDPKTSLFGKANFALGGKTLEEFNRDQANKLLIDKKIEQNKVLQAQRETTGNQILSTIEKSGMNQKQFLLSAGIALRGSNLNAKAIAKLRERGLI
jgi:hypothetical protein